MGWPIAPWRMRSNNMSKEESPMKVMLTSCGIETQTIKAHFLRWLGKSPAETKALFIPTAAITADAIQVLPACMDDLLKCGILQENIMVFDLHRNMPMEELQTFDVVYLCGGTTAYLLERINETGFRDSLLAYIHAGGMVIGVSAGSMIFVDYLPDNLGLLDVRMSVHSKKTNILGKVSFPVEETIELSNTAAMLIRSIPDDVEIIDG
ncbi:MAG: hypothetical protein E7323_06885 [Clostridiales bacterium]|nr:hypothetical protein [Clostridiales bacterium]